MASAKDPLEVWEYRIFRWVLFIIFVVSSLKFLNDHTQIGQLIARVLGK